MLSCILLHFLCYFLLITTLYCYSSPFLISNKLLLRNKGEYTKEIKQRVQFHSSLKLSSLSSTSKFIPFYPFFQPSTPSSSSSSSLYLPSNATDFSNRFYKERLIVLSQEVNDEMAERIIPQLLFLARDDPNKDITLLINSPG